MKFLVPTGSEIGDNFGVLTSYKHRGIPAGVISGLQWAGDNNCFGGGFKPDLFFPWLESMKPYKSSCIFVVCPDAMGDAKQTLVLYDEWAHSIKQRGFPVAFVAQDGQENLEFPLAFDALFIGGTTEWKVSDAAISCIKRAQLLGKHIHIGRVNYGRRYRFFERLDGSESFTCDGTRTRFCGLSKTLAAWSGYMNQKSLFKDEE